MPPFSAFLVSFIGLVASLAIYLGGQGKSQAHRFSVISGVAVVLCISVLPFYLLMAFDNLGSSQYEAGFIAYLVVSATSTIAALASCLVLIHSLRRPAA